MPSSSVAEAGNQLVAQEAVRKPSTLRRPPARTGDPISSKTPEHVETFDKGCNDAWRSRFVRCLGLSLEQQETPRKIVQKNTWLGLFSCINMLNQIFCSFIGSFFFRLSQLQQNHSFERQTELSGDEGLDCSHSAAVSESLRNVICCLNCPRFDLCLPAPGPVTKCPGHRITSPPSG